MMRWRLWTILVAAVGLAGIAQPPAAAADEELVLKLLVVNPMDVEKSFEVRSPLPPEIQAQHVLDADGLEVEYDSQRGTYEVVGQVTLKPKASATYEITLQDVWAPPTARLAALRDETDQIARKLAGTAYEDQGRVLAGAITRRLADAEQDSQQPFMSAQQHIGRYRETMKQVQLMESDLVSMRQLMVMAALAPTDASRLAADRPAAGAADGVEQGGLSLLATWRMIFFILGLLALVSLSFFLVWQRQLKLQLAQQATLGPGDLDASAPIAAKSSASS